MTEVYLNPHFSRDFRTVPPSKLPLEFHQRLPGYKQTPLVSLPKLAKKLNVAEIWLKDESKRLGLPAFKILGSSWAVFKALKERLKIAAEESVSLAEIGAMVGEQHSLVLVCATAGNHGRAVARIARILGISARIHVPEKTNEERIDAIEGEKATVVMGGSYDEAVERAARDAHSGCLLIQDTSWQGYEQIPAWIVEGYSTLLWEIENEMRQHSAREPTVVLVQMGVGSLAQAVIQHYRRKDRDNRPVIVGVEPERAACVLESVKAGRIIHLKGQQDSIMAGLNAGTMSSISLSAIQNGVNNFVVIHDDRAKEAMRLLAEEGIVSGETGAAGLGGLLELLHEEKSAETKTRLGLGGMSRVLLISTEGATDPQSYEAIAGRPY